MWGQKYIILTFILGLATVQFSYGMEENCSHPESSEKSGPAEYFEKYLKDFSTCIKNSQGFPKLFKSIYYRIPYCVVFEKSALWERATEFKNLELSSKEGLKGVKTKFESKRENLDVEYTLKMSNIRSTSLSGVVKTTGKSREYLPEKVNIDFITHYGAMTINVSIKGKLKKNKAGISGKKCSIKIEYATANVELRFPREILKSQRTEKGKENLPKVVNYKLEKKLGSLCTKLISQANLIGQPCEKQLQILTEFLKKNKNVVFMKRSNQK